MSFLISHPINHAFIDGVPAKTFAGIIDTANPKIGPWNILLSRLPLITATMLVLGTLSALLFYLINHIISVNVDKINMLKTSILSEQITGSLPNKDMSEDEIQDYKRNTKIELIQNVFNSNKERIQSNSQQERLKQILDYLKPGK